MNRFYCNKWFLCLILFEFLIIFPAKTQTCFLANPFGVPGDDDFGNCVISDNNGNIYITGLFWGVCDFDPGINTLNLTSIGSADIFISKYNPSGELIWAKSIGGSGYDKGCSIKLDSNGNVLITGSFQGVVDFNFGSGIDNLISSGVDDIFLLKVDSLSNYLWIKKIGGVGVDKGYCINIDQDGNVYLAGTFSDTVDFNSGVDTLNLISNGGEDIFIAKYNPVGDLIWAKSFGGIYNDFCQSIVLDSVGNVFYTGGFEGSCDFDPGIGTFIMTSNGNNDIIISKLDSSGLFIWAYQIGGISYEMGHSISIDENENIYITGLFKGITDFNPGPGTFFLTSVGGVNEDVFICKLNSNGDFIWAKQIGSTLSDVGKSIYIQKDGVYLTGCFANTADFDPGVGIYNLISNGQQDIFICKLDTMGEFIWAKQIGGSDFDNGYSLTIDNYNNVYTTGFFRGVVDFDPGIGTLYLNSGGGADIFLSKLNFFEASIVSNVNISCIGGNNGSATVSAINGNTPYYYLWNTIPAQTTQEASGLDAGFYSVTTSDNTGCTFIDTITLTEGHVFQEQQICLVSVDTIIWKNKIMWEKTLNVGIDYYLIYKETGLNNYIQIGNVVESQPAEFIDLFSVPESHGDKYKISVLDTCGDESNLSFFHKTMNLTIAAFGSTMGLNWDDYVDESGTYAPFRYYIYRGLTPTSMSLHDSVSGSFNSYNDINVLNVYYYIIGVKKDPPCNINGSLYSYSNQKNNSTLLGINNLTYGTITVSPNPFSDFTTIEIPNYQITNTKTQLTITDVTGKIVRTITNLNSVIARNEAISPPHEQIATNLSGNDAQFVIERGNLKPGVYFVELRGDRVYRGKLIVE